MGDMKKKKKNFIDFSRIYSEFIMVHKKLGLPKNKINCVDIIIVIYHVLLGFSKKFSLIFIQLEIQVRPFYCWLYFIDFYTKLNPVSLFLFVALNPNEQMLPVNHVFKRDSFHIVFVSYHMMLCLTL